MRELPDFEIYTPSSIGEVLEYLEDSGDTVIIAGGTDLVPMMRRGRIRPKRIIDISGLDEIRYVRREGNTIRIGALASINELARTPILDERYYCFKSLERYFGVETTRNMATVGGNLASGGERDLIQILLSLDAKVRILGREGERVVSPKEARPNGGEVILETFFEDVGENAWTWFSKFEKRAANGIGVVTTAVMLKLAGDDVVDDVRIVVNRVSKREPGRVFRAEEELRGRRLTPETLNKAVNVLGEEIKPASDFRASSKFRREVSKVMVRRAIMGCFTKIREKKVMGDE